MTGCWWAVSRRALAPVTASPRDTSVRRLWLQTPHIKDRKTSKDQTFLFQEGGGDSQKGQIPFRPDHTMTDTLNTDFI